MPVRFCPIASGSSGNCIYVGTSGANILIDAGISGKRITEGLLSINIDPWDIDAVFITHDHSDHVKGAGIFSRKYKKPIHATEGTWRAISEYIGKVDEQNVRFTKADKAIKINDIEVVPFATPHDGVEPVGFSIFAHGVKIAVATDIGCPTDTVRDMIKNSDIILLETNHDEEMLKNGPYPYYLKKRILSDKGHLSNKAAGIMLAEMISPRLKYIYLGHLSAENNTPRLAFDTVCSELKQSGMQYGGFKICCAERNKASALAEV